MTTQTFYKDNPKICESVFAAHEEANAFIKKNPADAAKIYLDLSKDRRSTQDEVVKMISDPDIDYTTTPANVMTLVEFMKKPIGSKPRQPRGRTCSFRSLMTLRAPDLRLFIAR